MNQEQFIAQVEEQTAGFSPKQKEIIKGMVEKILKMEHDYQNPIYYSKKVKDKDEQPPLNLYTVGVKERPLTFLRLTLNLNTNSVEGIKSVLHEETYLLEPLIDPFGGKTSYKPIEKKFTVQEKM